MSFVKEMLEREQTKVKNMEETLSDDNIQKLVLRAGNHINKDIILGLRGTKAIKLEDMSNTDEEYDNRETWGELLLSAHDRPMTTIDVTTWSSLVRNALEVIKPQLNYVLSVFGSDQFKSTYEVCMSKLFEGDMIRSNSNFVKRLYREAEETDLIKSTVYLSNKNHMLEIFTDENGVKWYACAVYTGEIIWVLEALLDTIYALQEDMVNKEISKVPHHTMVITYVDRNSDEAVDECVANEVRAIDNELQKLNLAKDILKVKGRLSTVMSLVMDIDAELSRLQVENGLPTLDDLLK